MKGSLLSLERELHIDTKASQSGNLIHSNPFNDNDRENTKTRMRGELCIGRKTGSSANLKYKPFKLIEEHQILEMHTTSIILIDQNSTFPNSGG